MYDDIVKKGKSILQHGKFNDRVYLMKLSEDDLPEIIDYLQKLSEENSYSKLFIKVPRSAQEAFLNNGYIQEAYIPKFYKGTEDAYFLAKYLTQERSCEKLEHTVKSVLEAADLKNTGEAKLNPLNQEFKYRICTKSDIIQMAEVYSTVFETYPFPIQDPEYIKSTMENNVIYFGVWHGEKIAALSSAELDVASQNAEMTDFATLTDYRGNGFANFLLNIMEKEISKKDILTAYTIARAYSYGMNITFAKGGYTYTGTLVNNTNISGSFESMNVWYKHL